MATAEERKYFNSNRLFIYYCFYYFLMRSFLTDIKELRTLEIYNRIAIFFVKYINLFLIIVISNNNY